MKTISIILLSTAVAVAACSEADLSLVNKVKVFSPQWTSLNARLSKADRNLEVLERRIDLDYKQIESIQRLPDSLRIHNESSLINQYKTLSPRTDSLRTVLNNALEECRTHIETYSAWEEEVMGGSVEKSPGLDKLADYKKSHAKLDSVSKSCKTEIEDIVTKHNFLLRRIGEKSDRHGNLDIKLE